VRIELFRSINTERPAEAARGHEKINRNNQTTDLSKIKNP